MATTIQQELLYQITPVGQQIMFTISNDTIVNSNFNVKFCAAVHISPYAINLSTNTDLIGTFKTTPNATGRGMFDLQSIVETFVKPDQEPRQHYWAQAEYKGVWYGEKEFPLHLVDKFALTRDSMKNVGVNFYVEYSTTPFGSIQSDINNPEASDLYRIFNGALSYNDVIDEWTGSLPNSLGFNMGDYFLNNTNGAGKPLSTRSLLSDAPTTQYATLEDYGTLPFLNIYDTGGSNALAYFEIHYYNSSGVSIGTENVYNTNGNGGKPSLGSSAYTRLNYFGGFPANLRGWSTTFQALITAGTIQGGYYTIVPVNSLHNPVTREYTIKIICSITKGYNPIRLTWLNKWGVWDYYTFNMKSTKTIKTKRIPYNQEAGTWNESTFKVKGYKGGSKNFRVNSTEKIKINTDFVTEAEGVWFEQLVNSVDVYILEGFQADGIYSSYNTYVQPVTVTTKSYTTKTIANDRLMQYTFEIEKSKMKRTQAV